jgi:hypothetical protein
MGTSQSNPGPGGKSPLVPPWADDQPQQPLPPPQPARFKPFRQSLGRFVSSGGGDDLRSALGHYARKATGGSRNASRRMGSVTQAGGNLYDFLRGDGTFAPPGETPISLDQLAGQPCELAIATITQALSSNGGDTDKIRVAMNHALVEALDGVDTFDPSHITDDVIVDTMIGYLSESIFLQIVMDAGKAWNKAETTAQILKAEADLRELVRVVVDKNMAPRLDGKAQSFTRSEIIQLERQVITEVWREWENYQ